MNDLNGSRALSKLVFGNRYMLEVCQRIASIRPDRVSLVALLAEQPLSASVYAGPLRRLAHAQLIFDAPSDADDRRERWYRAVDTSLWDAAVDLSGLVRQKNPT